MNKSKILDVTDSTYWMVDKSLYKEKVTEGKSEPYGTTPDDEQTDSEITDKNEGDKKIFRKITIKEKVDVANYQQIFTSFIHPLVNNNVDIEIKITERSTTSHPITETGE
jgi:hypothetical protein